MLEDAANKKVKQLLPSFMIIGPPKTATTSLFLTLNQHSQIAEPLVKEPNFYSGNIRNRGHMERYRTFFPTVAENDARITYDSTPNYFSSNLAADQIYETLGAIKVICILRDPVERFISQYKHYRALHIVNTTPEIYSKLHAEHPWAATVTWKGYDKSIDSIFEDHFLRNLDPAAIFSNGQYRLHLGRWIGILGRENVLPIIFDELNANPRTELARIQSFLGLAVEPLTLDKTNETRFWLDYCPDQSEFEFRPDQIETLQCHYSPMNKKLYKFLGRELSWNY